MNRRVSSFTSALVHVPADPRRPWLARIGDALAANRRAILALQWAIVVFYAVLVVLPALLPHPAPDTHLFSGGGDAPGLWRDRLVLLAQYLFWGVWWPFVIVSILLFGRVWCGLFCPEGALAEFASRHGRGLPIPRWLRWGGWPFVAFVLTTVYGQLISVYEYPQAALLILGGSTLVAVGVGFAFGRGKRVWCRYLCPVSGVFALLARVAPLHFYVDRAAWAACASRPPAVDCAPLLSVSQLKGMAACHACGRCSGHRGAVSLRGRSPSDEVLGGEAPTSFDARLLIYGLLGVAFGAFQWTVNPWFVQLKQAAAGWLIDRDLLWPFADSPAWWLLTRQPEAADVFSWLDGAAILVWIGGFTLVVGGATRLAVGVAARLAGIDWRRLALGLIPLAGIGLFLGLSMMTATHLRGEGLLPAFVPTLRAGLLALAVAWSFGLGARLIAAHGLAAKWRCRLALAVWVTPLVLVAWLWQRLFFST